MGSGCDLGALCTWGINLHGTEPTFLPSSLQALIKQDNLDAFNERDPYKADDSREEEEENDDDNSLEGETFPLERDEVMPPPTQHPPSDRITCPKGLPWAPKVR